MCINMDDINLVPKVQIDIVKKSKNGKVTGHIQVTPDGSENEIIKWE